jgi:hypothetical protein
MKLLEATSGVNPAESHSNSAVPPPPLATPAARKKNIKKFTYRRK